MSTALVQKLTGVRDLKKILETTVKDLGDQFGADTCQIMLSNPLDPNVTSICEYRSFPDTPDGPPSLTMPLVLHGRAFGSLSLSRRIDVTQDEVNVIRVILGELGDIIRHAQINDIIQRDTFRETFLVEIGNVMAYSLGIGDALFMVVNILGKVLQCSRCLFICTDDTQADWKCYEFWQQDKVQSCQDYRWPTTDSPLVAQTLLSQSPLRVYEGQLNSYVSPVQEELQFIGVRSLLGVALRSSEATHGCVILQQCDYRRAWTRNEIDMVQNVADKVAEALVKLPAEKRAREPIMQLHQRIVATPDGEAAPIMDAISVRKALKGALGQQAIPSAAKTSQPVPPKPAAPPPMPAAPPPVPSPAPLPTPQPPAPPAAPTPAAPLPGAPPPAAPAAFAPPAPPAAPTITPVTSRAAQSQTQDIPPAESMALGAMLTNQGVTQGRASAAGDPYANLDFGDVEGEPQAQAAAPQPAAPAAQVAAPAEPAAPAPAAAAPPATSSPWGDLDSIPTPTSGPAAAGLGGAILGKARHSSSAAAQSGLLRKAKPPDPQDRPAELPGKPYEVDEAAAQAKFQQMLSSADATSDYVFATPGLDMRMLGRIDGWIAQIEKKDKYIKGHFRQVAEYAVAIATEMGLSADDVKLVRIAALVHDVGKLGSAAQILQKHEDELSDPELLTVMKHPLDGAELLDSFPDLQHLAPIVMAHHEEYNGEGYPQGLKGNEIPMPARIIHVADSYHSMTSPTQRGPGMSATEAQNTLVGGAGKQWDPAMVQALIQAMMAQKVPAKFD